MKLAIKESLKCERSELETIFGVRAKIYEELLKNLMKLIIH